MRYPSMWKARGGVRRHRRREVRLQTSENRERDEHLLYILIILERRGRARADSPPRTTERQEAQEQEKRECARMYVSVGDDVYEREWPAVAEDQRNGKCEGKDCRANMHEDSTTKMKAKDEARGALTDPPRRHKAIRPNSQQPQHPRVPTCAR